MWNKPLYEPSPFLDPQIKFSAMKAAPSNALSFSSNIEKLTATQPFPTKFTGTHFLKLPQSFPKYSFLRASANPFSSAFLSISSSFNAFLESNVDDTGLAWNKGPEIVIDGSGKAKALGRKEKVITVVLLGWLGATTKHLKRYVEWYNSRGIHAVTFIVEMKGLRCFDPVARLDKRIAELENKLARWVLEKEEDGRERCLIFHTFSNTGWLVYGSLLDRFQRRGGLKEKIGGVIIDSGSADLSNPKVWAAGFAAAILKKCNSSTNGLEIEVTDSKLHKEEPEMAEALLLSTLEKFFTFLLNMPDVNRHLRTIIKAALENPPPWPQLYLYSTADQVIPYKSVERCVEEMSKKGIKVFSFNFGTSHHVDHYRNYPNIYSSELHNFLKECFANFKQT
ncbi:transmembrane protein 53-like [Durio zibethinus]|uniref:Transmembrane protein 53-like n=1 Tax=Durio zibethinus TaxID=66656 RepID=A0A6P6BDY7_DURZI|nr:transmembrane protein 53-like [Durio zibethinus]